MQTPTLETDTFAIIFHGVGDHSAADILQDAKEGLKAAFGKGVAAQEVELPGLHGTDSETLRALQVSAGGRTHRVVPIIWSRLHPRAAKEADLEKRELGASKTLERLFEGFFLLLPSSFNAIRCIPAASGLLRKTLVGLIALTFALVAPALCATGYFLVIYLNPIVHSGGRPSWWQMPAFIIVVALVGILVRKILSTLDFIGDVASYIGNRKQRAKAEELLLRMVRDAADQYSSAEILIVGHSLGSVLITQGILKIKNTADVASRLRIITMGAPLWLIVWFFPSRILSPPQLLDSFERQNLCRSWANLWRDADLIGRDLRAGGSSRFAETSLGDGGHTNYWGDRRTWRAVGQYLQATARDSTDVLASEWTPDAMSEDDRIELVNRAWFTVMNALTVRVIVLAGMFWVWMWVRDHGWLSELEPTRRWSILGLLGGISCFALIYAYFTGKRVGGDGASQRIILGRYRLYQSIAMACLKLVAVLSLVVIIAWLAF